MISVSRLICGAASFGDSLRYRADSKGQTNGAVEGAGPVVVWNCTRTCNLRCMHCYSTSENCRYPNELTTREAYDLVDQLARFRVPVLLISGGEPLIRPDILDVAEYATSRGIRVTFSTNGLLLTPAVIARMLRVGVGYVGISFDGIGKTHDYFRGRDGAYERSLVNLRNCIELGQKVGVRFTITRHNFQQIPRIFDLIETETIPRACFYHLVYSGRGADMLADELTHKEKRSVLDIIIARTEALHRNGHPAEILTVDNHADGPYIYMKIRETNPAMAAECLELLTRTGGNRSGIAIACVDNEGNVLPDQFLRNHKLGNIRDRNLGDIWSDVSLPLLRDLRNRRHLLKGRCRKCSWLDVCNGNFRARAEAATGNIWEADPACYLSDDECRTIRIPTATL